MPPATRSRTSGGTTAPNTAAAPAPTVVAIGSASSPKKKQPVALPPRLPFPSLMRDLHHTAWALDALTFAQAFGDAALSSREFIRALIAWATASTIAWDEALQALRDARARVESAEVSQRGLKVSTTAPWGRSYVRHAIQALQAVGRETEIDATGAKPARKSQYQTELEEDEQNEEDDEAQEQNKAGKTPEEVEVDEDEDEVYQDEPPTKKRRRGKHARRTGYLNSIQQEPSGSVEKARTSESILPGLPDASVIDFAYDSMGPLDSSLVLDPAAQEFRKLPMTSLARIWSPSTDSLKPRVSAGSEPIRSMNSSPPLPNSPSGKRPTRARSTSPLATAPQTNRNVLAMPHHKQKQLQLLFNLQQRPPSTPEGALEALAPGRWLSSTALDILLSPGIFRVERYLAVDHTFILYEDQEKKLGIQDDTMFVIQPLLVDNNHWTIGFFDLDNTTLHYYDSLDTSEHIHGAAKAGLDRLLTILNAHERVRGAAWSFKKIPGPNQDNQDDCGICVVVAAIYHMAGVVLPLTIDPLLWRRLFRMALAVGCDELDESKLPEEDVCPSSSTASQDMELPVEGTNSFMDVCLRAETMAVNMTGKLKRLDHCHQQAELGVVDIYSHFIPVLHSLQSKNASARKSVQATIDETQRLLATIQCYQTEMNARITGEAAGSQSQSWLVDVLKQSGTFEREARAHEILTRATRKSKNFEKQDAVLGALMRVAVTARNEYMEKAKAMREEAYQAAGEMAAAWDFLLKFVREEEMEGVEGLIKKYSSESSGS